MEKELIKMSDCPEIRDKWEPKIGDDIAIHHSLPCTITGLINRKDLAIDYEVYSHKMKRFTYVSEYDSPVYIPRIEDVLEWLGGKYIIISSQLVGWELEIQNIGRDILFRTAGMHLLAILIVAYMHLEHNKTWNGEAWV